MPDENDQGNLTVELMTTDQADIDYYWGKGMGFGFGFEVSHGARHTENPENKGAYGWSGYFSSIESKLEEGKVIGLSCSILDFDGSEREGHVNLSHDTRMVKDASYLCVFELMGLENQFIEPILAEWSLKIINIKK